MCLFHLIVKYISIKLHCVLKFCFFCELINGSGGFSLLHSGFLSSCSEPEPLFTVVRRLQVCRLQQLQCLAVLRGLWELPLSGTEPVSPVLPGGFLATGPPRKPLLVFISAVFVVKYSRLVIKYLRLFFFLDQYHQRLVRFISLFKGPALGFVDSFYYDISATHQCLLFSL